MPIIKTLKNGQWTPVNSVTSLGTATPSTAGLMSASDKSKLDEATEDTGYVAIPGSLTTAGGDAFCRRVGKAVLVTIASLGKFSVSSSATVIGTLPEDCRPSKEMQFAGAGQGATITNDIMFSVKTNGTILVYSVNTTVYYSGTFMFFVD